MARRRSEIPPFDPETEAEIARAAEITPEDIERAARKWREYAPPEARKLLDAKTQPGTERERRSGKGTQTP